MNSAFTESFQAHNEVTNCCSGQGNGAGAQFMGSSSHSYHPSLAERLLAQTIAAHANGRNTDHPEPPRLQIDNDTRLAFSAHYNTNNPIDDQPSNFFQPQGDAQIVYVPVLVKAPNAALMRQLQQQSGSNIGSASASSPTNNSHHQNIGSCFSGQTTPSMLLTPPAGFATQHRHPSMSSLGTAASAVFPMSRSSLSSVPSLLIGSNGALGNGNNGNGCLSHTSSDLFSETASFPATPFMGSTGDQLTLNDLLTRSEEFQGRASQDLPRAVPSAHQRLPRHASAPALIIPTSAFPPRSLGMEEFPMTLTDPDVYAWAQQKQQQSPPGVSERTSTSIQPQGQTQALSASPSSSTKAPVDTARYKTSLCRNWKMQGSCPYGDHCVYAHGPGELRSMAENASAAHSLGVLAQQLKAKLGSKGLSSLGPVRRRKVSSPGLSPEPANSTTAASPCDATANANNGLFNLFPRF